MNTLKWLSVLCLATACGARNTAQDDSDTDDLSSATVSMEMVRANPSIAPSVVVPKGVRVNGRARPVASDDARDLGGSGGSGSLTLVQPGDFLYTSNQLGQFSKLPDPDAFNKTDA